MQVIIFDKKFQCLYRLRNIPRDWNFQQVYDAMEFPNDIKDYNAFRLADHSDLCIDEYRWNGEKMILSSANCS